MLKSAPAAMAKVFVKASGEKSSPSCPSSAKIGKNETTMSARAKKIGLPTSWEDFTMMSILSMSVGSLEFCASNLLSDLWAFSIMTMLASTMAPMAMAMPPRLIMFEPIPKSFMSKNVNPTVSGKTITTMRDERKCMRKRPIIATTIRLSSMSVLFSVSTALSMSPERS